MFLAARPAAQQKHPQRMTGLLQLRRSALRMLIFYAAPPLLMGKSGHRLRFDVIFRNTPAFLAPRSGELPGEARLRDFSLPACGRRSAPDRPGCCCPEQICRSGGASSGPAHVKPGEGAQIKGTVAFHRNGIGVVLYIKSRIGIIDDINIRTFHIQAGQLIVLTIQVHQHCILAHIQTGQIVFGAIQFLQLR